jgi:hypothetical protein
MANARGEEFNSVEQPWSLTNLPQQKLSLGLKWESSK